MRKPVKVELPKLTFNQSLKILLNFEGGVSSNKYDLGGLTNMGITQSTFDSWNAQHKLPPKSVKLIQNHEVVSIYKNYWKCSGASKYNNEYGYHLFDVSVNSNCKKARDMDAYAKGDLGKLVNRRKLFYNRIVAHRPSQRVFIHGWLNRVNSVDDKVKVALNGSK